MKAPRRKRLLVAAFVLFGSASATALVLLALEEGVDAFVPPARMVDGSTPIGERIRAGGMVVPGSVVRGDDLVVRFALTDLEGHAFDVEYHGILPDLFREGQGILATGRLRDGGVFAAEQVLAKHDENYHPPELEGIAPAPPAARGGR